MVRKGAAPWAARAPRWASQVATSREAAASHEVAASHAVATSDVLPLAIRAGGDLRCFSWRRRLHGWWRAKVDRVAKFDGKKAFTHALTFQKIMIHDTGQIWARAKGTKNPAELKEEGYGTECGGRWVLLDSAPN